MAAPAAGSGWDREEAEQRSKAALGDAAGAMRGTEAAVWFFLPFPQVCQFLP